MAFSLTFCLFWGTPLISQLAMPVAVAGSHHRSYLTHMAMHMRIGDYFPGPMVSKSGWYVRVRGGRNFRYGCGFVDLTCEGFPNYSHSG